MTLEIALQKSAVPLSLQPEATLDGEVAASTRNDPRVHATVSVPEDTRVTQLTLADVA